MTSTQRIRPVFGALPLIGVLCLLAACGSPEIDTHASADQPYETLRSAVSPCPGGPPPSDIGFSVVFEQVDGWYRVDDYSGTPIPAIVTGVDPGELAAVSLETGEVVTLDIVANPGAEAAITWGVSQASALYLGVDSLESFDYAAIVMAELPDGSAFFPGECAEDFIGDPLRQNLGDDEYSRFIQTALELTGTDIELYVSTFQQR